MSNKKGNKGNKKEIAIGKLIEEDVTYNSFLELIYVIGEYFKSSLGPKGLDKTLYDKFNNDLIVSNDGSALLDNLNELLNHKISKIVLNWGREISNHYNDGIKTFYILLNEFLRNCQYLESEGISKPDLLRSIEVLIELWKNFTNSKYTNLDENLLNDLNFQKKYLKSLISGKLSETNMDLISDLAIKAVIGFGDKIKKPWFNIDEYLHIEKIPGIQVKKSQYINGILVSKKPVNISLLENNKRINPNIILIRQKLYYDLPDGGEQGPHGYEFEIDISNINDYNQLKEIDKKQAENWFQIIKNNKIDVILTEKGVNRTLESILGLNNVILVRRVKENELNFISQYLDIKMIDNINEINPENIKQTKSIEWKKIGREKHLIIQLDDHEEKKKYQGTFLLGGTTWYVCLEVERFFKKLIKSLIRLKKEKRIFYGGGNTEFKFYKYISDSENIKNINKTKINEKVLYSLEELKNSFLIIPKLLMESVGFDIEQGIAKMNAFFTNKGESPSFDLERKDIIDIQKSFLFEDFSIKSAIFQKVFEILKQIVNIDTIIQTKKQPKSNGH